MNLTNYPLVVPAQHVVPLKKTPPTIPMPATENAPMILRQLGHQLGLHPALRLPATKLAPSHITNFQESNLALQTIFSEMVDLMKNENPSKEILLLEGQLKELKVRFDQLENEGSLSPKEVDKLQKISNRFYEVLSSMDDWFDFQERYFLVDDQLSASLEAMQLPLFNDLHGWSLPAFQGMATSLNQLMTLIQMSNPVLREKGVFSPELLGQLKNSIHATFWSFNDWFHEIFNHGDGVVSVAMRQWEQANQQFQESDSTSFEAYSQMQLAAEQLLLMKHMLEQMEKTLPLLPNFQSIVVKLNKELKKIVWGLESMKSKKT